MNGGKIHSVAVGGTFDRLHRGHRALLFEAFEVGEKVTIGVSSDEFVESMHKRHQVQPYEVRVAEIQRFLKQYELEGRVSFVPLDDPYGPTVSDEKMGGIVVSGETAATAVEINRIRKSGGLRPLKVFCVDLVLAEDGKPISSTRIRLEEIDQQGKIRSKNKQS